MKVGIVVPQGWTGEYQGWDPVGAWTRTVALAAQVEQLGFESAWVFDHLQTIRNLPSDIMFESFATLTALACCTARIRLGHVVLCAGFRNPALVAKMISTIDVISGGRVELGVGAGWKQDEWLAYGYAFPSAHVRLGVLADQLEVFTRMLRKGPLAASYGGAHASVSNVINAPPPIQADLPIVVGGNGRSVTWRLAVRYADELNLDGLSPDEVELAMPVIRSRCEEAGRDPTSLRISVHVGQAAVAAGAKRVDLLSRYRELGVARTMEFVPGAESDDEVLARYAEDVDAAGCDREPASS